MTDTVTFSNGHLHVDDHSLSRSISSAEVDKICICSMEDEIHHGVELFHILIMATSFILIGPFVDGADGAIDEMTEGDARIGVERYTVRKIPYRFREPGFLGLRLFPVPGLYAGTIDDLKRFHLTLVDKQHEQ